MKHKQTIEILPKKPAPTIIAILSECPFVEDWQDVTVGGVRKITVDFNAPQSFYNAFRAQCRAVGVKLIQISDDYDEDMGL